MHNKKSLEMSSLKYKSVELANIIAYKQGLFSKNLQCTLLQFPLKYKI